MHSVAFNNRAPLPQQKSRLVPATKEPCFYDERLWDLDASSFADIRHAQKLCLRCPRLQACRSDLAELEKNHQTPRSQVMAGRVFNHRGKLLENENEVLQAMNKIAATRMRSGGEDNDPLVAVDDLDDLDEPAVEPAAVIQARETLRALDREVQTRAGVQFTLDLSA